MENIVHILYLNSKVLGVFDKKSLLDSFVEGCIQNNFIKRENLSIEIFEINTCYKMNTSLPFFVQ
jgi:hypothetical protein